MDKVIRMCIVHDMGEAFTGDIPVFQKTPDHEAREEALLRDWVNGLPESYRRELGDLYAEMEQRQTLESKIYKALDGIEALIQHNLSDIDTWLPGEYTLQQVYAQDRVGFSKYLTALRQEVLEDTLQKIADAETK